MASALAGALGLAGPAQASFPGTNGLVAYASFPSQQIFLLDPTLSPPVTQQITTAGSFFAVNFDATGRHLVAETNAAGIDGVVFLDPKSESPITPLPGGNPNDAAPTFDPTGTKVAFHNAGDIFIQNVDGTGRTNLTAALADNFSEADWSPDGQFIAVEDDTDRQVKSIAVADGAVTTLTPPAAGCAAATPCQDPSYSGDGLHVAYDHDGAAVQGIYDVLSSGAATSVTRLSTGNDDNPAYAPQSNAAVFNGPGLVMFTVPSDGSMTRTQVGEVQTGRASWGIKPVEPTPVPPSNVFTFGALTRDKAKGTATQTVTVPGPGELVLGGSGVVPQRPSTRRSLRLAVVGGDVLVKIKAKGKAKDKLKKKGKATVNPTFTFTPTGGTASTQTKQVKLKKAKKK
jgi:dipeptidyl aminopeptidase/acylaminoacyl peptidase